MCGRLTSRTVQMTRSNTGRYSRQGGFTITEVVIASLLLAVALIPIIKAMAISQTNTNIIERKSMSLILAEGKLDEIRTRALADYDDSFAESSAVLDGLYLCTVTDTEPPVGEWPGTIPGLLSWLLGLDDPGPSSYLRMISVFVGFDLNENGTLDSDEIHVTLSTYVAERS